MHHYAGNAFLADYPNSFIYKRVSSALDKKAIALTFDDGPGPDTAALLDVLKAFDVRAAFFMLAQKFEQYPYILKQMLDAGHTVAMHGVSHHSIATLTASQFEQQQLTPCKALFEQYGQFSPSWYRPPFGEITAAQMDLIQSQGLKVAGWSADPNDWFERQHPNHVERVVNTLMEQVHPGGIILLHDAVGDTDDPTCINDIVSQLLPRLLADGFEFVTLDELSCL